MDVPEGKPWFVPKRYGYGSSPASWQGWAVIGGFLAAVALLTIVTIVVPAVSGAPPSAARIVVFMVGIVVLLAVLFTVLRLKTAGAWEWRWGPAKK